MALLAASGATAPAWLCLFGMNVWLAGRQSGPAAVVAAVGPVAWLTMQWILMTATVLPGVAMIVTLPVTGRVSRNEKWACALLGALGVPIYWLIFVKSLRKEREAEPR